METRANYATIGLFTLIVIALGFGFVYWLKRYDEVGARKELRLEFDGTVNGLAKGGFVYFNGIKVGVVSSLTFDPENPNRVIVIASIARTTPVKPDTRAEVNFNFLTGVAYVELFGGSLDRQDILAQPGIPTLQGVPSSLTDVISGANRMFRSAEASIDRLNEMIGEVTPSVTASIKNVESFTEALANNAEGVDEFLKNVSAMSETVGNMSAKLESLVEHADQAIAAIDAEKVSSTIDSAQSFMKRIDDASAEIGPIVTDVRKAAGEFSQFSTSLNTTVADLQKVIGAIDSQKIEISLNGISSFAGKLGNASEDFDQIVADAKEAADNVNAFTTNIRSHTADIDTIIAEAKQLTTRVNAASARLDGLLGKADQFLGTEGGENFFTEAASAARAIQEAAEAVSRQTNAVGGGLAKFSGPGLDNVQALISELRASVARIDRAVSSISRDPSSVVFGSGGNSGVREYNRR